MAKPWEKYKSVGAEASEAKPWEKYAANAPTLEYEEPKDRFLGEGLLRGSLQALPAAGALGGAVFGTALGPAGTFGGGVIGAAGGKALQNVGEKLLGDEVNREQLYLDPVREGAFEAGAAGVGGLIRKAGSATSQYIKTPITNMLHHLSAPAKESAEQVAASAQRLGAEPTKGMLSSSPFVQKIESGLSQTSTTAGQEVADKMRSVGKAMEKGGEKIFSPFKTSQDMAESGILGRGLIEEGIEKKLEPAIGVYRQIEKEVPFIDIGDKPRQAISRNILNLPYAKIKGSDASSFADQISENLLNTKNLEELRNLKSYVGRTVGDPNISSNLKHTAGEIYGRLSRLEQNSITRAVLAIEKSKKAARTISGEMIGQIKGANKIYASVSESLKNVAKDAGLGKISNYQDFIRKVESLSDEKVVSKFFNPQNKRLLTTMQKEFPEAFESLKKAKMSEIYTQSLSKGELSLPKLITNFEKLGASRKMILGPESEQIFQDIKRVYNAIPGRVGPSGTPEGLQFVGFNPFSLKSLSQELPAKITKSVLDNPQMFKGFKNVSKGEQTLMGLLPRTKASVAKEKVGTSLVPRGLLNLNETQR